MGKIIVFIAAILAGTTGPVLKLGLDSLSPVYLMFIRFSITTLIFGGIYLLKKETVKWKHLKEPFKVSLLSATALVLMIFGLNLTTVSSMQAIFSIRPLFIAVGAYYILGEEVSKYKRSSLTAGFIGLILIVCQPIVYKSSLNVGSLAGNLLLLGSAIVSAFFTIRSKKISKTHSPKTMTLTIFITTSIVFTSIILFRHLFLDQNVFQTLSTQSLWVLAYLVIFSTLLTFYLYIVGLKMTSATLVGISQYVQFLVTVVLGVLIFGDSVTPLFGLGSTLILAGAYVGSRES